MSATIIRTVPRDAEVVVTPESTTINIGVGADWSWADVDLTPAQARELVAAVSDWLSSATPDKEIA